MDSGLHGNWFWFQSPDHLVIIFNRHTPSILSGRYLNPSWWMQTNDANIRFNLVQEILDNGWPLGRRHDVEHSNQYISHFIEENAIENVVWNRELSCFSFNMLTINSPMSVAKKLGVLISLHVTLWTIVYLNNDESLNKSCFMFINNNYLLWPRHTEWRHQMETFSL